MSTSVWASLICEGAGHEQRVTVWQNEKERDFTRLECGLLGAMFTAVTIGFLVVVRSVIG